MSKAPEGIEYAVFAYLTSDATGLEARIQMSAAATFGEVKPDACEQLAQTRELQIAADDWRPMTRAEIAEYKRGQGEEE